MVQLVSPFDYDYGVYTLQGSSTMAKLRRFRMCRSRLGSIFMIVLIAGLVLFIVNYFHGFSSLTRGGAGRDLPLSGRLGGDRHLSGMKDSNDDWPFGEEKRQAYLRGKGHRFHFDDDNEDEGQICKMPKLSLAADVNKEAFPDLPPLQCRGEQLMYVQSGYLHINRTVLHLRKLSRCDYQAIKWQSDNYAAYSKTFTKDKEPFEIKVKHDFFRVRCFLEASPKVDVVGYQTRRLLQNAVQFNRSSSTNPEASLRYRKHHAMMQHPVSADVVDRNDGPNMMGSMGLPDPPVRKPYPNKIEHTSKNVPVVKERLITSPVAVKHNKTDASGRLSEGPQAHRNFGTKKKKVPTATLR